MSALAGMITYGLFLIFIVFVILKIRVRDVNKLILFVSIAFGVLAFFQRVSDMSDLSEAFGYLNGIRGVGFSYFQNKHYEIQNYYSGKIGLQVYFYLCSLLPYNNFYSAIAVFITYFCILKSVQNTADYYTIDSCTLTRLMVLTIVILDFYDISNGVRNMFAFSIFVFALSLDIFKGRRVLSAVMYLVAASIHPSTMALIVLRYIQLVKSTAVKIIVGFMLVMWSNGLQGIASLLEPFSHIKMVSVVYGKLAYYSLLQGSNENFGTGFNTDASYIMMRYFRIGFVIIFLIMIIMVIRRGNEKVSTFGLYLGLFSLGTLAPILATNVFTRYSMAIFMLTPSMYCEYLAQDISKKKVRIGRVCIDGIMFGFIVCAVLFNYYMFMYHYSSLGLTLKLYQ